MHINMSLHTYLSTKKYNSKSFGTLNKQLINGHYNISVSFYVYVLLTSYKYSSQITRWKWHLLIAKKWCLFIGWNLNYNEIPFYWVNSVSLWCWCFFIGLNLIHNNIYSEYAFNDCLNGIKSDGISWCLYYGLRYNYYNHLKINIWKL